MVARKVFQFSRACAFMFEKIEVGQESMLEIRCLEDRLSASLQMISMTKDYFPSDWTYLQNYKTYINISLL